MQTDLLIFSGQSNMQGQTGAFPDPNEPVENAWEYRLKDDACIPLRHPCGEDVGELLLGADRGQGSLVPAFCRAYVQGTRNRVIAVHAAKGATTIAEWQEGGPRFAKLVEKINGARRRQSAACGTNGKVYLIWLQGESDALAGTSAAEYESALTVRSGWMPSFSSAWRSLRATAATSRSFKRRNGCAGAASSSC